MKNGLLVSILLLFLIEGYIFRANAQVSQGVIPGTDETSAAGPADESTVLGNGTQPGQNKTGANVNTFTGDVEATATDFSYTRNGFPLKYERYFHNGITSPFAELGQGWMSNYDICLFVPLPGTGGDHALLVEPHQVWRFATTDGGNTFTRPPGCFFQLQNVTGTYVLTDKVGIVLKFQVLTGGEPNIARLVEMDDLNGNKVTLTYGPCIFFNEKYETDWSTQFPNSCGTNSNPPSQTYDWYSTYQSQRLTTVTGPNSNWTINFNYYDNNTWNQSVSVDRGNYFPDFAPLECCIISYNPDVGCVSYDLIVQDWTLQSPYSNRLKSITNSVGDTLTFDTGGQTGPITQVSRSPTLLNASYQYYSYVSNPTGSNATTVVTLKQIIDPLAPPGYRNLTYVSESNTSSINNPVRQIRNALGQVMYSYDYSTDGSGNKLTSTNGPNGLIQTDVYNSSGVYLQKRFVIDGHPYTEFYTFNSDFLPVNVIDGNGHAVTMTYDSLGSMTYQKDAENYAVTNVYNNSIAYPTNITGGATAYYSRLTSSTDKNLNIRNYSYDGNGNLTQVSLNGVGTLSTYGYTFSNGSLTQKTVTDANNHITTYSYDANGNVSSIQEPNMGSQSGLLTSFTYDPNGRNFLASKTTGSGNTQYTINYLYNSKNFLQTVQYPDSTTETYLYDSDGDKTQFTDRNIISTTFAYDNEDRLIKVAQAVSKSDERDTTFQLDSLGSRTAVIDNKNQKSTFVFNEQNLVRMTVDSMGIGYTNTYDGALNVLTSTDKRGKIKTITYFKNNRIKLASFSDGTPSVSYTYDGNGNRTTMIDGAGMKTYSFDALGHLLTYSDLTRNFNQSYTYDNVGNRLSEQNNKISGTIYYSYYENNLLKTLTDVDGMATTYIYDALKHNLSATIPNGASVTYAYDYSSHTNRLLSLQNLNSHGEILSSFSYSYDSVGNINRISDLSGPTSFTYDDLYQLTSATYSGPESYVGYAYDGVGNRIALAQGGVTQTLLYQGNELKTGADGETFQYDMAGNILQRTLGSKTINYNWDTLNQLVKITTSSGAITYIYDGDGHRVQKISGSGTTNYFYDNSTILLETDGNGKALKTNTPGISFKDQKGNKYFFLYNGHGDVAGLMDINQNLVMSYSYDAFGATLGDSKDLNNTRYAGRAGVFSDDDASLQYMWHRWYDPKIGRFISKDPMGFAGGNTDLYLYIGNNPEYGLDPAGLYFKSV